MLHNKLILPGYNYGCRSYYYIKGHKTKPEQNIPHFKIIQLEYIASHRISNKFVNLSNCELVPV